MTTHKQAFSRRNTANNAAAQRGSAERRRCPACDRKAALTLWSDDFLVGGATCRYCGYERATDRETGTKHETFPPRSEASR